MESETGSRYPLKAAGDTGGTDDPAIDLDESPTDVSENDCCNVLLSAPNTRPHKTLLTFEATEGATLLAFEATEGATLLALEDIDATSKLLSPEREISSTESESSSAFQWGREFKEFREDMDPPISGLKKSRRTCGRFRFQDGYPSVVVGVSSILKLAGRGTFFTPSGTRWCGGLSLGELLASGSVLE